MGGTVVSYDEGSRTASVQPGVHRLVPLYEDEDLDGLEIIPIIQNVPVMFPIGRGFRIDATLEQGDPVLLVCLDRDNSGWLDNGQPSPPADPRLHHWSNAVAIPGLLPTLNPLSSTEPITSASRSDATAAALVDLREQFNALLAYMLSLPPPIIPIPPPTPLPYIGTDLIPDVVEGEIGSVVLLLDE